MIPLLFCANSSIMGGASLSLLELLHRLPHAGYRATVVAPESGPFPDEAARAGAEVRVINQPTWVTPGTVDAWLYSVRQFPQAVQAIGALIDEIRPALVWTNTATIPAGAFAAAIARVPHLWCVQEFLGQGGLVGPASPGTLRGCIQALSARVVAISSALRGGFPEPELVAVISAPVDLTPFRGLRPDHGAPVITTLGTISESKGLGDLAEAGINLAERGLDFSVQVIGDFYYPDYLAQIQRRLVHAGARERFQFIPFQRDIAPWLARSGLYCCPSHTEGMSRTIIEAMAAGLSVVATDCGGPRDLVADGVNGCLVPVRDPCALADALANLLMNPAKRMAQGEAGRAFGAKFDADIVVPRLVEEIDACCRAAPAPATTASLVELMLTFMQEAGPRVLLGKKWRLLRPLLSGS